MFSLKNFRSHYRPVHKEQFNELCNHTSKTKKPVEAATNIKQTAMPFCKRVPDSELRGAILDFIVGRNLAFDIVNDVSFRKLLLLVKPNELNIPGTTAIMNELKTQYLRSKATLKKLLKKIDYVCTTADVWSMNCSRSKLHRSNGALYRSRLRTDRIYASFPKAPWQLAIYWVKFFE